MCTGIGVSRDEVGKRVRGLLMNGLSTRLLDFILKSAGSHLRI